MAITKTLYLLVALVLLQGALSMPSWRRQQQEGEGRQGRNGGGRGGSSEEEDKTFFDICRIVNQTAARTLCMEDSQCPANSACMMDFVEDSVQFYSCLPQTCTPTTSCPSGTNCTQYTKDDGTTQTYCLPEDFVDDYGSWESDFDGAYDGAYDGTYDDGAYGGGYYDDGWQYYFGGFFGGRRKRQTMESCRRALCRIHNQGRGGRDGGGRGGRGGNGGFFPRPTTPGQDQPESPDQTTPEQNQPLFPNPGQNPGQFPGLGQPQNPDRFSRGGGRLRGQRRQGGTIP